MRELARAKLAQRQVVPAQDMAHRSDPIFRDHAPRGFLGRMMDEVVVDPERCAAGARGLLQRGAFAYILRHRFFEQDMDSRPQHRLGDRAMKRRRHQHMRGLGGARLDQGLDAVVDLGHPPALGEGGGARSDRIDDGDDLQAGDLADRGGMGFRDIARADEGDASRRHGFR